MDSNSIIVEQLIHAAPAEVWDALTQKEHMKQWYFDVSGFKPEVAFEFSFAGEGVKGEKYLHLCRITEVVPQQKLQYTWQYKDYDGISTLTFDIKPKDEDTLVRVQHEGLESFPSSNPDFARDNFREGWTYLIQTSLKNYLENKLS